MKNIIKLKNRMNIELKMHQQNKYEVKILIPLTKSWAYYKDTDSRGLNEWLVHITCPGIEKSPFCWTYDDDTCSGCDSKPSKTAIRKKSIISKLQTLW